MEVTGDEVEAARMKGWVLTCIGKWPKHSIFREEGYLRIEFQVSQGAAERLRGKGSA